MCLWRLQAAFGTDETIGRMQQLRSKLCLSKLSLLANSICLDLCVSTKPRRTCYRHIKRETCYTETLLCSTNSSLACTFFRGVKSGKRQLGEHGVFDRFGGKSR